MNILAKLLLIALIAGALRADLFDPLPELKKEVIVRPQDIDLRINQQAFADTVLKLKAADDVRIVIKVRNGRFASLFS